MRRPKLSAEDAGRSTVKRSSASITTSRMAESQEKDYEMDRGRITHDRHRSDMVGIDAMRRKGTPTKKEDDGVWIAVDIAEDGYFWRKYGEKIVHSDTDKPQVRSYFKCGDDSVDGRHCPARKCIDWNVQVRPIMSSVTYTLKHTHPPSDNPRRSIRPMRKLKVPSFLMAAPTEPMRMSGDTSRPPRISSCPKLPSCISCPSNLLKTPQVLSTKGTPYDQAVGPKSQGPDSHESSDALHNLADGSSPEASHDTEMMENSSVHQGTAFLATIDTAAEFYPPQYPPEGNQSRQMADPHAPSHDPSPSCWLMPNMTETDDLHALVASATRHIRSATSGASGTLQESCHSPLISVTPASGNMEPNAAGVGASAHLGNGSPVSSQACSDSLAADAAQATSSGPVGSLDALSKTSVPPGASPLPSPAFSGSTSEWTLLPVTGVLKTCSELEGKLDVEAPSCTSVSPVNHLSLWQPQVAYDIEAGESVHSCSFSQVFKILQQGPMPRELDALLKPAPAPSPSPIPSAFASVGCASLNVTPISVQENGFFPPANLLEMFHPVADSEMHSSLSAPISPKPSHGRSTPSQSLSDKNPSLPCDVQEFLLPLQSDPLSHLFDELQSRELCLNLSPFMEGIEVMVHESDTSLQERAPMHQLEINKQQGNECNLYCGEKQKHVQGWEEQQKEQKQQGGYGHNLTMQVEALDQEKQQQQFQLQLLKLEAQLEAQSQLLAKEQREKRRILQNSIQHLHQSSPIMHGDVCGKTKHGEMLASTHLQPALEAVCLHLILSELSNLNSA